MLFDVDTLVQSGGVLLICLIIFAETGLLVGLLFPGDSLLLAAGLFAARGHLPIEVLVPAVIIAAIVGNYVGYAIGRRAGPRVFKRQDGLFFRQEYVERTENFFKKHGGKTVVMARFIPYMRTFTPVVAGVGSMDSRLYNFYNILGALLWAGGVTMLGYLVGDNVPNIDKLILVVFVVGFVLFNAGLVWHFMRSKDRRSAFKTGLKEEWNFLFKSRSRKD